MDYQKLILRIKCPEIRECPFQEPMSCTKCRNAVGEDSVFAIKELLSRVEELEAKNNRLEQARENANAACAKWEGLYRAELEKKGTWVSVKDRLPEDYQRVLCLFESGTMEVSFRASVKGFCYEGFKQTGKVTHWMPLPEPPKEE